jgi:hypothetical protein
MRYPPLGGDLTLGPDGHGGNPTGRKSKMTHNLKALGLALLAVFAFGAVAASSASAVSVFESEKEKTVLTGGEDKAGAEFGTKSSTIKVTCKKETFGGTVVGSPTTATKVTVHPKYEECEKILGNAVTVETTGCDYILYAETNNTPKTPPNEAENQIDAPVEIECTAGSAIKIKIGAVCTLTITSVAEKLHGVVYDNEGTLKTRDIKVTPTVDKIKYSAPGIGCRIGGLLETGEDGFLTRDELGNKGITVKGFEDKELNGPSPHQEAFMEGSQVGILWVK